MHKARPLTRHGSLNRQADKAVGITSNAFKIRLTTNRLGDVRYRASSLFFTNTDPVIMKTKAIGKFDRRHVTLDTAITRYQNIRFRDHSRLLRDLLVCRKTILRVWAIRPCIWSLGRLGQSSSAAVQHNHARAIRGCRLHTNRRDQKLLAVRD